MEWTRTAKREPREGQEVLGYDRDLDKVYVFVYRGGSFHHRDEEHFHGCRVTWWAPVPVPPLGRPRRERKRRKKAIRRRETDRRRRELAPEAE
jgi:hypothetical protein